MNIGKRVRQLRQAKNMKIADLAEAIGVDAANISRLETGKQKQFTEQALSNIARCHVQESILQPTVAAGVLLPHQELRD